jgi:predicted nucleotidyltransferase component of viral defense system
MLLKDAMPPMTKDVFEILQPRKELESFVLIGGTALALQAHHRLSEDLDFWLPADSLNTPVLANLIRALKHDSVGSKQSR